MGEYQQHVYRGEEQANPLLTATDMKEACSKAGKSAAGPDGYEPGEMALLSDWAYQEMADLLNLVEAGEEWPQGMQHGRVAYLEKEHGECDDALKFRPLVLLPALL